MQLDYLYAFIDSKLMTKYHILATNSPMRIIVPIDNKILVKLKRHQKHGWQIRAKEKNLWKRKAVSLKGFVEEKPLDKEDFSQRSIANDEYRLKQGKN